MIFTFRIVSFEPTQSPECLCYLGNGFLLYTIVVKIKKPVKKLIFTGLKVLKIIYFLITLTDLLMLPCFKTTI